MRLNKYLASAGVASRREADRLIQAATTTVNGVVVTDPAYRVQPGDRIEYDGRRLVLPPESIVIMLNKPRGVIATVKDTHGRRTVLDLVPVKERLFPIGRLDRDTTGLLLLTNDGELAHALLHPRHRIPRIYQCEIEGRLTPRQITRLARGVVIGRHETGRAEVLRQRTVKKRSLVTLQLYTGKKREIRRLFAALRVKLYSLHRTQYGPLQLGNLAPGQWRPLSSREVRTLKAYIAGRGTRQTRRP
jgi:23S rRNA pseudouridine2605 synthase